jgi:hypothetical protein
MIERGQLAPPAEDKVVAIARELDQDPDVLLALADRVASDVTEVIKSHPEELTDYIRKKGKTYALTGYESTPQQQTGPKKTCITVNANDSTFLDVISRAVEGAKEHGKSGGLDLVIDGLDELSLRAGLMLLDVIFRAVEGAKEHGKSSSLRLRLDIEHSDDRRKA